MFIHQPQTPASKHMSPYFPLRSLASFFLLPVFRNAAKIFGRMWIAARHIFKYHGRDPMNRPKQGEELIWTSLSSFRRYRYGLSPPLYLSPLSLSHTHTYILSLPSFSLCFFFSPPIKHHYPGGMVCPSLSVMSTFDRHSPIQDIVRKLGAKILVETPLCKE